LTNPSISSVADLFLSSFIRVVVVQLPRNSIGWHS
jgi:hypothetical protein